MSMLALDPIAKALPAATDPSAAIYFRRFIDD